MQEELYHLGVKAVLQNEHGLILLLKVNKAALSGEIRSYWDMPGGCVQQGQSVEATLKREVAEETAITTFTIERPLGMVLSLIRIPLGSGKEVGLILSLYLCTLSGKPKIVLSDEHVEAQWVTPHQAAERLVEKYPAEALALIRSL